ncbi:hypothetical protein M5E87_06145 [Flavonifractor plautii]|nr:hypothetical protein M5E87_06145 [Flavonifractor plautii]
MDASHSIRATFQRGTEIPDFGPVVGEVYISIENNTYWGGDFTGTLASGWYDLCAEDTMMTIVLKALALDGYSWWGTGASDTGGYDITYLSGIYMDKNGNGKRDNSEPSLAEFDGSRGAKLDGHPQRLVCQRRFPVLPGRRPRHLRAGRRRLPEHRVHPEPGRRCGESLGQFGH